MEELIIGDKVYISSKKAAQITGYAKDYVGQLCREGHVDATMVGRNWYVLESSIKAHRFGAPAAVATQVPEEVEPSEVSEAETEESETAEAPLTWKAPTYASESPSLIPNLAPVRRAINLLDDTPGAPTSTGMPAPVASAALTDMQSAWQEWFSARKGETYLESPEVMDARDEAQATTGVGEVHPASTSSTGFGLDEFSQADIRRIADEIDQHDRVVPVAIRTTAGPMYTPDLVSARNDASQSTEELEEGAEPVLIHHSATWTEREPQRKQEAVEGLARRAKGSDRTKLAKSEVRKEKKNGKSMRQGSGMSTLVLQALLCAVMLVAVAVAIAGSTYAEQYMQKSGQGYAILKYLGGARTVEK